MKRALDLAILGRGKTSPNPLVGCVIVKDNKIIGEGWHKEYGKNHAEIEAINDAKFHNEDIKDSTVYVTLEPCSHFGKTPPCANRLISEGVKEVVIAMSDPNPKVNGNGIKILREAGIKVTELTGEIQDSAKWINRGFIFVHKYQRPFITLKAAMSLDGKLCLNNGESKWITGIESRTESHLIRAENDAVLVGVNTILKDDPELTVRHVKGKNPLRVVLDRHNKTPLNAKIRNDENYLILNCDIKSALKILVEKGILNLMVEGGAEVLSSFLREGLADYAKFFYSPRIFGEGKGFNLGMNFNSVQNSLKLKNIKSKILGEDILIEGRFTCSPDL